ncbi:MAG: nicotinamide-nucleotide amidohydrolase family protein, partial [Aridibacter sp.]
VVLPGPPRELKPMFETHVLPKLKESAGEIFVRRRSLRVSGMGESSLDELIAPIYTQYKNPQTATLFNKTEIEIQLTAQGKTKTEAEKLLDELAEKIADKLGIAVFALNGEKMEEIIGKLLIERCKTLSVAESCTGGLIGERLTDVAGSSKYFIEGIIAYHNDAKVRTLNVAKELIEKHGAVSAEVAEEMAKGIREKCETDYAISVTGIAGPSGGTEEKPVGTVFVGYSDKEQTKSLKLNLPGDRNLIRWRSSQAALDYLRRQILKITHL